MLQGLVEAQEIQKGTVFLAESFPDVDPGRLGTPLGCLASSIVIDQNAPHQSRSESKELQAVFESYGVLADKAQINFVDQSSRLESMVLGLAPEMRLGQAPELFKNQWNELL